MPCCGCIAEGLVTIEVPTSCTRTSDAYTTGKSLSSQLSPGIRIALRENLVQSGIVPVDVIVITMTTLVTPDAVLVPEILLLVPEYCSKAGTYPQNGICGDRDTICGGLIQSPDCQRSPAFSSSRAS